MEKPLQIAFKDTESSEFLERLIRERVARLERFHAGITGCRVVVDVPHRGSESGKSPLGTSVEVDVPGRASVVAKGVDDRRAAKGDHTAVLNRVFDAVQRQLDQIEDIRHGAVKAHAADGETGQVVRLFPEEGHGFVEVAGGGDLYFTRNAVIGGTFDELLVGALVQVTRATGEGPMGPQASSVRALNARRSAS